MTHTTPTSEKAFSDLWERALELRPTLVDWAGDSYDVMFPGIRNQGPGPDFKGAVLRHQGRLIAGDVELHLHPSGWRSHAHHIDPAYRGVVLQVVLSPQSGTQLTSSPPTATAVFPKTADRQLQPAFQPTAEDVERLGIGRFLAKSSGFALELRGGGSPDQVIYSATMEALGYVRNQRPFRVLSAAVPIHDLQRFAAEPLGSARFGVLAVLAKAAGLDEQMGPGERLQARRLARMLGVRRRISPSDWSGFRVRPGNVPLARIRGAAHLIAATFDRGLAATLRGTFLSGGVVALARVLERKPFIGSGLAQTIMGNVTLPAIHAWLAVEGDHRAYQVVDAFRHMPSPPPDSVTRGVVRTLGIDLPVRTAAHHFGLHALARSASWPGQDIAA